MPLTASKLPIAQAVHLQLERVIERTGLDNCGWVDIHDALAILIDSLNSLREEGVALKPDVFLFREADKPRIKDALGFHHYFQVGSFKRDVEPLPMEVFTTAIKKCAPLAKREWSIFIKWTETEINFGVMRRLTSLTKESPRKLIMRSEDVPALLLYQAAENSVEIRSHGGFIENIRFSAMNLNCSSPEDVRQRLIASCVTAIGAPSVREKSAAFLSSIFHEAVVEGHGFLVGVHPFKEGTQNEASEWIKAPHYHRSIKDGNYFQKWIIPLSAKVELYKEAVEAAFITSDPLHIASALDLSGQLRAWADLVPTMLSSDGMTLLNSKAQVLGYRIFIADLPEDQKRPPKYQRPDERSGGARWRAFKNMWLLVDAEILVGAYYQSQDGAAFWYGP